jgi:putative ABC transport system permease protein
MNQASVIDGLRDFPQDAGRSAQRGAGRENGHRRCRPATADSPDRHASRDRGRVASEQQYQAELIGLFALLALALAAVGVYGLLNYAVARRAREIGIRIALGATSGNVAWLVVRRGAMLVVPGLVAGIVIALATTRVMGSLLYGISTTDPMTFMLVPALMIALAVAAGLAPTRRAASVDPAITLREE